jgi:hypothetical protein
MFCLHGSQIAICSLYVMVLVSTPDAMYDRQPFTQEQHVTTSETISFAWLNHLMQFDNISHKNISYINSSVQKLPQTSVFKHTQPQHFDIGSSGHHNTSTSTHTMSTTMTSVHNTYMHISVAHTQPHHFILISSTSSQSTSFSATHSASVRPSGWW